MKINRGDLYYADLEGNSCGSEQVGIRPVVVLQNNIGNEYSPTVIVAPITSKTKTKAIIPTHVFIKEYGKGLKQNSIILLEQIRVIDKTRVKQFIGALDGRELEAVDKAIIISLGIDIDMLKRKKLHKEYLEEKTEILTRKQIASYGIVAKNDLDKSGNLEITNKLFGNYILTLMDLYSPDEIEKRVENIK